MQQGMARVSFDLWSLFFHYALQLPTLRTTIHQVYWEGGSLIFYLSKLLLLLIIIAGSSTLESYERRMATMEQEKAELLRKFNGEGEKMIFDLWSLAFPIF